MIREKCQKGKKPMWKEVLEFPRGIFPFQLSLPTQVRRHLPSVWKYWIITNYSKFWAWAQSRAVCFGNKDSIRGSCKEYRKGIKKHLPFESFSLLKLEKVLYFILVKRYGSQTILLCSLRNQEMQISSFYQRESFLLRG